MECIYIRFMNPRGDSRTIIIPAKDRTLLEELFGSAVDICQKNRDINCCCLYPRKCDTEQMSRALFGLYSSSLIHGLEPDQNGDVDEKVNALEDFLSQEPNIYVRVRLADADEENLSASESLFCRFLKSISPLKTPPQKAEA